MIMIRKVSAKTIWDVGNVNEAAVRLLAVDEFQAQSAKGAMIFFHGKARHALPACVSLDYVCR